MIPFLLFSFLLGLCFGSFANVYFYRLPEDKSLFRPGSFCPNCNTPIRWYDNIPLISFGLLAGRCRSCSVPISPRYPLVELGTGLLFVCVAFKGMDQGPAAVSGFLFFCFLLFLAAGIDIVTFWRSGREYGIIPDHLIWLLGAAGLLFSPVNPGLDAWWNAPVACAAGFLFMYFFRWLGEKIFSREALGFGDVKLVAVIGLWLGWRGMIATVIAGSTLGTLLSLVLMGLNRLGRRSTVPFAPFLVAGAFCAFFFF